MQRAAIMRQDLFGINESGEPQMGAMDDTPTQEFACYFAPGIFGERATELGFIETHDTILRVAKSETNFRPVIGKIIRLFNANPVDGSDLKVRIQNYVALSASGPNPEFIVSCKNEF
jgi:hypothetical protein